MHDWRLPAAAAAMLFVWAPASAAPASTCAEHRYEACLEAPSSEACVVEVRVCSGPAGVPVRLVAEPDAAPLSIGRAPLDEPIGIGWFHEPSSKIEWVGLRCGSAAEPGRRSARSSST